jgi:hypothetical protein
MGREVMDDPLREIITAQLNERFSLFQPWLGY